jgi:signal transduction histidine kinase
MHQQNLLRQEQQRRKMYLVIFGFVVMLLIAIMVIYRQRQQRQTEQLIQQQSEKTLQEIFNAEQKERIRIARDLHDSIGQKLAVMRMLLPKADGNKELEKVSAYLDETANEVRSISHNLIPEILNFGLVKAVENLVDRINSTENICVDFTADEELYKLTLSKQTELSLYRIIQEIISNIIRHSKTEKLKIELNADKNFVHISITDSGIGFNTEAIDESKGLGWKNIFARIKLINGNIKIQSEKNKGSNFLINIPIA